MAFLIPDNIRTVSIQGHSLEIKEKIIPDSARASKYVAPYVQAGKPMKPCAKLGGTGKPRGVTIHNTEEITVPAGTNPAEQYTRATWPNCNMGGVVVHFFVWHSEIWQNLAETEQGWHAGDGSGRRISPSGDMIGGNLDTIAIECIGSDAETEETAAKLAAYLLQAHGLTAEDLYTHNFFMGQPDKIVPGAAKNCPIYILPHWSKFRSQVAGYLTQDSGIKVGDSVTFLSGNIYLSSTATSGTFKAKSACKVTATAPGKAHPYHLISQDTVGIYGWADAKNVELVQQDGSFALEVQLATAKKRIAELEADVEELTGALDDNIEQLGQIKRDIAALAKKYA